MDRDARSNRRWRLRRCFQCFHRLCTKSQIPWVNVILLVLIFILLISVVFLAVVLMISHKELMALKDKYDNRTPHPAPQNQQCPTQVCPQKLCAEDVGTKASFKAAQRFIKSELDRLQNPPNCAAAKSLVCAINDEWQLGEMVHQLAYCVIVAWKYNRTMIIQQDAAHWRHLSHCKSLPGWNCIFQGVGGCSYADTLIPSLVLDGRDMTPLPSWSLETEEEGSAPQVVQLETLNFSIPARLRLRNAEYFASSRSTLKDRHPFFIPNKLLEPLINLPYKDLDDLRLWFVGQLVTYILYPNRGTSGKLAALRRYGLTEDFAHPIAGIDLYGVSASDKETIAQLVEGALSWFVEAPPKSSQCRVYVAGVASSAVFDEVQQQLATHCVVVTQARPEVRSGVVDLPGETARERDSESEWEGVEGKKRSEGDEERMREWVSLLGDLFNLSEVDYLVGRSGTSWMTKLAHEVMQFHGLEAHEWQRFHSIEGHPWHFP